MYEYGHERTFTSHELASLLSDVGCRNVDRDGFYVAYGLYRHKGTLFGAGIGAKMINRIIRVLDVITGRAISRNYGFEVVCVGRK